MNVSGNIGALYTLANLRRPSAVSDTRLDTETLEGGYAAMEHAGLAGLSSWKPCRTPSDPCRVPKPSLQCENAPDV